MRPARRSKANGHHSTGQANKVDDRPHADDVSEGRPLRLVRMNVRILAVFLVPFSIGTVEGCRSVGETPRLVCSDCDTPNSFVRLQAREPGMEPKAPCGGPVLLSREEWKTILQSIRVQPNRQGFVFGSGKGPVEAAFSDEEIEYLSKALAPAFRQARPDDIVVFGLARLRAPEVEEVTTGGWCVRGENLILMLANRRFGVSMTSIRDLLWKEPLRSQRAGTYDFAVGEYQAAHADITVAGYRQTALSALAIRYQLLLASHRSSSEAATVTVDNPRASLEARLRALKRLHEQGLITDEEYRGKKQQILDQL